MTKSSFYEDKITNLKIETDGKFYLFEDDSVNSVRNILRVYDHLLDAPEPTLYSRVTSGLIEPSRAIRNKLGKQAMIGHAGQMGGEYPLSSSQREAVACFDEIGKGEVLAVNGPPGTGKTTLLQSIVADLFVKAALAEVDAPEVGCAAFAFAKRAIVVGDEMQIPPVWGVPRVMDITMAISNGVISCKAEFNNLEENGLNCSQSSLMRIASRACPYEKYGKGLFLSEHRRCYNEIIQYCNDLVYKGKLEPLRGGAYEDANNVLVGYLLPMGYKQIETATSQRVGTSRYNEVEAKEIVGWLNTNYTLLIEKYKNSASKEDEIDESTIVGVITPFKAQCNLIKQMLKKQMPELEKNIAVGTVHAFQGAERKVIIFSSVYGNVEGCFFINNNASLMNVAVSRAKDSFLIFGDMDCLVGDSATAGGKLRMAAKQEIN